MLLVLLTIPSASVASLYVFVFALGSIGGLIALTSLGSRGADIRRWVQVATGTLGAAFGVVYCIQGFLH